MQEDPVVRSARREAIVTMIIFCAALAYTIGYCISQAYGRTDAPTQFYFGFPDWVFWGIIAPWFVCVVIAWWFAYRFMTDEPLDTDVDDSPSARARGGDEHGF